MLTASQDIDSFIERQRSKLNKQPSSSTTTATNSAHHRLDHQVARILDDPPPRHPPPQQSYYPPPPASPPTYNNHSMPEQQPQRRLSDDNTDKNSTTFFNKFGTYDDKRSQLKDDLKREYNEYLQSKQRVPKSKSTSQLTSPRAGATNKRVQFQQPNGKVVAPWEKNDKNSKPNKNVQSMNDLSTVTSTTTSMEYSANRSRPPISRNSDEQYIGDREAYIGELHSQIRELEMRRRQLEMDSNRLSAGGSSTIARAHYSEDMNALNSLLAERLDQRNAVDHELAHILNRPPLSSSPTRVGSGGMPQMMMPSGYSNQPPPQRSQQPNGRQPQQQQQQQHRNDNGFQIGQDADQDEKQAQKKRYQQELQAQMRETQMRKAQAKQERNDYDRKMDAEIERYNYFGRSGGGGGAPMRDKDGNVVANLADVRNPAPPQQYQQQQQQAPPPPSQYMPPNDKVYSLGSGPSAIANTPYFNGEHEQPYPGSERAGSPNHARGAMSNGMFGAAKTEAQFLREEKYKLDLKRQIDEKRQRETEEVARRRAEEDRELAKHMEWQQQMDKQVAEDAVRKQEKETQDRFQHQQMQEELEKQRRQEELAMKRKSKRPEKPPSPKQQEEMNDENEEQPPPPPSRQHQPEPAFRSSSPPIPALKNKGKKPKAKVNNVRRPSFDDVHQQQSPTPPPLPPFANNDDYAQLPPIEDTESQGGQTYRKPPTPRQPDIPSARKKPPPPPQMNRPRPRADSNSGMPIRANSTTSLRSDGSDSEVLNRLEHLKRQLKDKEARLQDHVSRHQTAPHTEEPPRTTYQPPSQAPIPRRQSPGFLINAARVHHRDSPIDNNPARRILHTDDEMEFKPSYFRDDTVLMGGRQGSAKRVDSGNRMFITNTEKEASRRRYGYGIPGFDDREDPTSMANYELNRIAEQNEHRLKKLRDLEKDDVSLLDSNEVLERFQQKHRLQRRGSQTTLQDDAWLK